MRKGAFFVRTFLISALSWNGSFNSFVRFCHDATTVVLFVEITERTDEENKEAAHSITERRRPYVILRTGRKFLSSGLLLPYLTAHVMEQQVNEEKAIYTVALTVCGKLRPIIHNRGGGGLITYNFCANLQTWQKSINLNGFSEVADDHWSAESLGQSTITIQIHLQC